MKVLLMLGHSTGGIGVHVAHLAAALRATGQAVTVVAPDRTAARFDFGRTLRWWPEIWPPRSLRAGLTGTRQLRTLIGASDVLHAHGHQAGLVAALLCLGVRRPPRLIVSWHNAAPDARGSHAITSLVQRFVVRRADLVTGASSDLVDEAVRLGARRAALAPVPSPRVPGLLAEPAADLEARTVAAARLLTESGVDAAPDLPLVLTISRVAPQKNLPVLVAAAAQLRLDCTWVVIGDGDPALTRTVRDQARAADAPVQLLGAFPDVGPWLHAASVFVLPSRWEARALVVQEAMAAGTPVIASDVGGLHDLLDGVGLLVPVDDPDALAEQVRRVLGSRALRQDLAGRGRVAARNLPDADDMVAAWLGWYAGPGAMT